jgi:fido (protein-threonine AMPylation protein)
LDFHEEQNILEALTWTKRKRLAKESILTMDFIKTMHQKMFSETWKWAG